MKNYNDPSPGAFLSRSLFGTLFGHSSGVGTDQSFAQNTDTASKSFTTNACSSDFIRFHPISSVSLQCSWRSCRSLGRLRCNHCLRETWRPITPEAAILCHSFVFHALVAYSISLSVSVSVSGCVLVPFFVHHYICAFSLTRKLATSSFCRSETYAVPFWRCFCSNWELVNLFHIETKLICILLSKQKAFNDFHTTNLYISGPH